MDSFDSDVEQKLDFAPVDTKRASRRYLVFPMERNKPMASIPEEIA
jgi:hypothetical protein